MIPLHANQLSDARGTSQLLMEVIYSPMNRQFTLVCLDDMTPCSRPQDKYIELFTPYCRCCTELHRAGGRLRLMKFQVFTEKVDYLGLVIRPGRSELSYQTRDTMTNPKPPRTVTVLKQFLGLSHVYRRFVPSFALIAGPLNAIWKRELPGSRHMPTQRRTGR